MNVVLTSTVVAAVPILPHVGRSATVMDSNTVEPALWSVAIGVAVPRPSLLLVLSYERLALS